MRRALLPAAALLAFAALRAPAQAPEALYGRRVTALRFDGDAPLDARPLAELTDLRAGQTLTQTAVRTAMRNLFATRRFSDLSIEAAPAGDGVAVVIRFSAAPRIDSVTLTGVPLVDKGRVRDALGLETGETWAPDRGEAAERGARRVLRELGHFEPRIAIRVEPGPDDTSVALAVSVSRGPVAVAAPPLFVGATEPFTAAELARRLKQRVGVAYHAARARDDADRLAGWLHQKGYARAEVRYEGEAYDERSGSARARYSLFVGPKVVLEVTGASLASVRDHPDSPWSRGEAPDEDAVRRLRDALVRTWQEKGFAKVEVDAALRTEPGRDVVTVAVRKGARWSVAHVGVEGNHSLRAKDLLPALRTQPRGVLAAGRLVQRDLDEDRTTIESIYASRGYPDVKAGKPVVADAARPYTMDVTFRLEEREQVLVASRRVDGNVHVGVETLLPLLSVTAGQPYTRARVVADEAALQGWYLAHGYPDVRVTSETSLESPAPPRPLAAVIAYHVSEGDPVWFGKTVVRGNAKTLPQVIEGEFAHAEGEPFALGRLIETQQSLTRLGVFSRIDVTFFPTDPETKTRTVVLSLAEAKRWSLLYGVGAEYDQHAEHRFNPRLSLGVTYTNLFGRALVASAEGRYSVRDKRLVGSLRDPTLFSAKVPVSLTVFRADQIFESFEVARSGMFLDAERRFKGGPWRATLRYQYEIVKPNADPSLLSQLERQNQAISISSVGPGIIYDTRNDPVDPHSGILASLDAKYAFPLFAADATFLKGLLQAAVYRPFQGTVLTASLRVGGIRSYASCDPTTNPACLPNLTVPIVERFFAGGRSTHRAFPLDQLGIPGQTLIPSSGDPTTLAPSGGNGLVIGNLEWRIPVAGDLGVSLFLDTGNVWADFRSIKLSQVRTGAGLGLHYLTPVGPLRLEYGWKLDRKVGESAGELSFSVGYPF